MDGSSNASKKKPFARLPAHVAASHYVVTLKPDLEKLTFTGSVEATLEVRVGTEEIVCNAADLEITDVVVDGSPAADVFLAPESETMTVRCGGLQQGKTVKMSCRFAGELNDKMVGFYRSRYTSAADGSERHGAVTQFEATDARRCFPCWDEPALKATFDVVVSAPKDRVALSNMPVRSEAEDPEDGARKVVSFETTPSMSTYLLAVVVGEYDHVEALSEDGVAVRVYTPVGKSEQGRFALEATSRSLSFYRDFFGIAYPLRKYDCAAIADFQSGAMENWGLVTFREAALLIDPSNSSSSTRQWVAVCVTHEAAHQWFGNLVTMEWWTHLWLNEGFACFMENACTDALYPEFDIWTQFVSGALVPAFELDALDNSHPVEVAVGHPDEVNEIFDNISYNKGAAIIRMLHDFVGDEAFRKGMRLYLARHSYGNAVTEQLWAALEESSGGKPIGRIMSTWTGQKGFPVVSVERVPDAPGKLRLSQEKFTAAAAGKEEGGSSPLWRIPVKVLTSSGRTASFLLDKRTDVVDVGGEELSWFKANAGVVGFYRVAYRPDDLELLRSSALETLSEVDRLSLVDDLFAMVRSGRRSAADALRLLSAYRGERGYVVWSAVDGCLAKLRWLVADDPRFEAPFRKFVLDLMSGVAEFVGWEPAAGEEEPHTATLLRSLVLGRLGALGHPETRREARRRFDLHLSGEAALPADVRAAAYRAVAADGGVSAFEELRGLFRLATDQEERDRIARSMGACSTSAEAAARVLEFAMSDEVRMQDAPFVVCSVACSGGAVGRDAAWAFFRENFSTLKARYEGCGMLMARVSKHTTENFTDAAKADEVEAFFAENPNPAAERTVRQSVETVRLNAAWLARDRRHLEEFFLKD